MRLFLLTLLCLLPLTPAFRPLPQPCPSKCHFPLKPLNRIPCPFNCQFYACRKDFGPLLPAFGLGLACASPGLPVTNPPEDLPNGKYKPCYRAAYKPIADLPFLAKTLPEAEVPRCPRACACFVGRKRFRCGRSDFSQPPRKCRRGRRKGSRCCSLPVTFYN